MRPNPFLVDRQPPAKVRGKIVRADISDLEAAETEVDRRFRGLVNRIDDADLIIEGARYLTEHPPKFFGSAVLILRRVSDAKPGSEDNTTNLLEDKRLRRLIDDRLYLAILRHLGSEATATFDWQGRESHENGEHRVFMDFECALAVGSRLGEEVRI